MIADRPDPLVRFFEYAKERHHIYLKRSAGMPQPWTEEGVLQNYRFTNVFRELDKVTVWLRENVRMRLLSQSELLLPATVLFRMFNRITTAEAIFTQQTLPSGNKTAETAFDLWLGTKDLRFLRGSIKSFVGKSGPYVTGAYIISTPPGSNKLDGVLKIVDGFSRGRREYTRAADGQTWPKMGWKELSLALVNEPGSHTMQGVFDWLRQFPYLGKFHSYEIVCDLRYTRLLDHAPDVNTWANMGPGAQRGLNRIWQRAKDTSGRDKWGGSIRAPQALEEMQELLKRSRDPQHWPRFTKTMGMSGLPRGGTKFNKPQHWPAWELREVEHTLCEFDKFERTRLGEGRPRGVFP